MRDSREELLESLRDATDHEYRLRWVDDQTTRGDFDGRDCAIDVFDIPLAEQLSFLKSTRELRDVAQTSLRAPLVFVFHTPEATSRFYECILEPPRIENSWFMEDGIVAEYEDGALVQSLVVALVA